MIGFGEAAQAFAPAILACGLTIVAYDRDPAKRPAMDRHGVTVADGSAAALAGASAALSLVTADQALAAAQAATTQPGAFWFDMNSVAPHTKRAAAEAIAAAGGRYLDVAVLAPVLPGRETVPLLVSGEDADEGAALLRAIGFANIAVAAGSVGTASSIKMIRSIMVKGIEALSAECALAANTAGVLPQVIASLDASWPGADWGSRFDYNLDRMMVHGIRRAAEMREVVATLDHLDTGATMTRGTVERQAAIGAAGLTPPAGLAAKLAALSRLDAIKDEAA